MAHKIALFVYDFPHRKSHDFIIELAVRRGKNFCVIAAPRKELNVDRRKYFDCSIGMAPPISAEELCRYLGVPYFSVEHEDCYKIEELRKCFDFELGLIAGARIIPGDVIKIFPKGIVNFHPGLIPQTSGLDAFYYSVIKNVEMGVTVHLIDERVDAGGLVFFESLDVGLTDTPEIVQFNNYQLQIKALRRLIDILDFDELKVVPLNRPFKNSPLTSEQKFDALNAYPAWRARQYHIRERQKLFKACVVGDLRSVLDVVEVCPELLESVTPEGWTPLIISSFNGHIDIVEYLLSKGANVNACGFKGTTVFMYAKSQFVNKVDALPPLLSLLIRFGADIDRCDMHGLTVLDYVELAGDKRLLEILRSLEIRK
ncbi:formyltransferase family protein [Pseudomonas sp. MAC6]|uniref:formyltransferase family protein n=1 Tax=Pseudomonas sp. MAC6 TaxID=3401633 RepID=UPI003BF5CC40